MHVSINLEPTAPRLHAAQFAALVNHYLRERARHLDRMTIKGYRIRLNHFLRWWDDEGPERNWMLDEEALAEFAKYVRERPDWGWWNSYDVLRRLRQCLRWAHRRNYVAVDFAEFVPSIKGSPPPRLPIHLDVLAAMLKACDETDEPERNRAIIAILAGTGVRSEECAAMPVQNVFVYSDGSGIIRLTVAKNDNLRNVAFDSITGSYLCEWIVLLPYRAGPLFPSRNGRNRGEVAAITPSGQHKILCRIAELAGVRDQISGAHDLRRMFATQWNKAAPEKPKLLQTQMGHANFQTTQRYILSDSDDVREAMTARAISPLARLAYRRVSPSTPALLVEERGKRR